MNVTRMTKGIYSALALHPRGGSGICARSDIQLHIEPAGIATRTLALKVRMPTNELRSFERDFKNAFARSGEEEDTIGISGVVKHWHMSARMWM